jgi:hypothetical protein
VAFVIAGISGNYDVVFIVWHIPYFQGPENSLWFLPS